MWRYFISYCQTNKIIDMTTFKISENTYVDFFDSFSKLLRSKNNRHQSQSFLFFGKVEKIPIKLDKKKIKSLSESKYCLIYNVSNYWTPRCFL